MGPTITDMRAFRRRFRPDTFFSIRLDDGKELVVHEETLVICRLRVGLELTDEIDAQIAVQEQHIGALEKAIRLIGRRPHSRAELREKLAREKTPSAITEDVLDKLVSAGLVNDEDFAWRYARAILKRKRIGERQLRQQLQRKGISAETTASIVRDLYPPEEQLKSALELARKKKRSYRQADPDETWRKLAAFLAQRGYPPDIVRRVIKDMSRIDDDGSPLE